MDYAAIDITHGSAARNVRDAYTSNVIGPNVFICSIVWYPLFVRCLLYTACCRREWHKKTKMATVGRRQSRHMCAMCIPRKRLLI